MFSIKSLNHIIDIELKGFRYSLFEKWQATLQINGLAYEFTYFVKYEAKDKRCYTDYEIISILEFLIYIIYIFVQFGRHNLQRIIGIFVGINCIPLLADLTFINDKREANLISLSGIMSMFCQS